MTTDSDAALNVSTFRKHTTMLYDSDIERIADHSDVSDDPPRAIYGFGMNLGTSGVYSTTRFSKEMDSGLIDFVPWKGKRWLFLLDL